MRNLHKRWKAVTAGLATIGLAAVAYGNLPAASAEQTSGQAATAASGTVLSRARHLVTVAEVRKADPKVAWSVQIDRGLLHRTYCGVYSTEGRNVASRLARAYTGENIASYGRQHVTAYRTPAAAKAAYYSIVKTVLTCTASKPVPTHARKITENRVVKGAAGPTRVIRWYDYPLPNDPGSEAGGFPYAITLRGSTVSVLAFSGYGPGMAAPNFDRLARMAAAKLPS
ncbi:hypothetical protein ABZX12_40880 [Kribbella sp. NPDC003505]|uniref:hypothetical protein n=1 Tax=Kribbella sp. NPDC003505 TaxID=3154448 RepID=UPI0033ADB2F3